MISKWINIIQSCRRAQLNALKGENFLLNIGFEFQRKNLEFQQKLYFSIKFTLCKGAQNFEIFFKDSSWFQSLLEVLHEKKMPDSKRKSSKKCFQNSVLNFEFILFLIFPHFFFP